ncbi:unnamed protein product [Paramecium primaurelia]|uniref:Transmembrane protein n=1 Tax=Paramecium primaurelia TaxID=5886 RepID=A0A8S1JSF6_PARPR|nr:unnamed protein product [Paramecium primaurelia]
MYDHAFLGLNAIAANFNTPNKMAALNTSFNYLLLNSLVAYYFSYWGQRKNILIVYLILFMISNQYNEFMNTEFDIRVVILQSQALISFEINYKKIKQSMPQISQILSKKCDHIVNSVDNNNQNIILKKVNNQHHIIFIGQLNTSIEQHKKYNYFHI